MGRPHCGDDAPVLHSNRSGGVRVETWVCRPCKALLRTLAIEAAAERRLQEEGERVDALEASLEDVLANQVSDGDDFGPYAEYVPQDSSVCVACYTFRLDCFFMCITSICRSQRAESSRIFFTYSIVYTPQPATVLASIFIEILARLCW